MLKEITAKSILRPHKKIDSWFLSSYAINLYRGCLHNCVYCDGRNEKYQVEGEFGKDISVKRNAIDLLKKELNPERKRKPFRNGFFMICGGISDSYQPFESQQKLCRQTLEILCQYKHPVHILTKSILVERDLDLLLKINQQQKAIVSFSFSSIDDKTSRLLEPGVPCPQERLACLKRIKAAGLICGIYLMPLIPFITDSYEMINQTLQKAKEIGVDFVVMSGLTLKTGRQKEYFLNFIKSSFPEYFSKYNQIYSDQNSWGAPSGDSLQAIEKIFVQLATKYDLPKRIPLKIFSPLLSKKEQVLITLEQLDYLIKLKGEKSPYGYAAYSLSKIDNRLKEISDQEFLSLKGVGPFTLKLIREIIVTGRCRYYEKFL